MHNPRISIIIPTCNRSVDLARCLELLGAQALELGSCEIIVCDDGTTDQTHEMITHRFPEVAWHAGPKRGPAANRNLGASYSKGEWLLFLDDDCIPGPDYLKTYSGAIRLQTDHQTVLYGPTIQIGEAPSLLWEAPHNPTAGKLITANFAIPKQLFLSIGGFDERYTASFEDMEFAARLIQTGRRVEFIVEARADHPLRRIPHASKLADRWESRVIYALDQGASPTHILWRLPWHCLRVIQSRFRKQPWNADNWRALLIFGFEWILVSKRTPQWLSKWTSQPRASFWTAEVKRSGPVPKYGF